MLADQLLTTNECCDTLQVSRTTLYQYVNTGVLPPPIKIGALSRWRLSDLDEAIDQLAAQRYGDQPRPQPAPNTRRRRPSEGVAA